MSCKHLNFDAKVKVNRIEDLEKFVAELTISCVECQKPFRFVGVPAGCSYERPTGSVDWLELRAPIEPEDSKRMATNVIYEVGDTVPGPKSPPNFPDGQKHEFA